MSTKVYKNVGFASGQLSHDFSMQSILDVFVVQGLISNADAEKLKKIYRSNRDIERVLLSNRVVSQETINKAYSILLKLPYISLDNTKVDRDVLNIIPRKMSAKYGVVAFGLKDNNLQIAVSKPSLIDNTFDQNFDKIIADKPYKLDLYITGSNDFNEIYKQYKSESNDPDKLSSSGMAVVYLRNQDISHAVLRSLPLDFIERHRAVFFYQKNDNTFAMAAQHPDAADIRKSIDYLEKENGIKIQLFATSPDDIDYAIETYRDILASEELMIEQTRRDAEMKEEQKQDFGPETKKAEAIKDDIEKKEEKDTKSILEPEAANENIKKLNENEKKEEIDIREVKKAQDLENEKKAEESKEAEEKKKNEEKKKTEQKKQEDAKTEVPDQKKSDENGNGSFLSALFSGLGGKNNNTPVLTVESFQKAPENDSTKLEVVGETEKKDQPEKDKQLDDSKKTETKEDQNKQPENKSSEIKEPIKMVEKEPESQKQPERAINLTDSEEEIGSLLDKDIENEDELKKVLSENYIPKVVAAIINYALKLRSSDIHIESSSKDVRVRYRVDGMLRDIAKLPLSMQPPVVSRIKILSKMKIDETRIPQDGRFNVSFKNRNVDVRVSALPTVHGEKIVMRVLDKDQGVLSLEDLGMMGRAFDITLENIAKPHGIILSTGPTGSGKSTTLYAVLNRISTPSVNIITLEDPVEYEIPGVNQCQIKPAIGFTFAEGLRSVLRQDPNIVMVGEIRDGETASMATHAALTGHLVLSTLHTNDASGALPRLINMGIEPFLITSSINEIIAQRLIRRICPKCKEEMKIPQSLMEIIKRDLDTIPENNKRDRARIKPDLRFFHGVGCEECNQGYRGRLGIFEVLRMTEKIEELAIGKRSANDIKAAAVEDGMITMRQDGILKCLEGATTIDEVFRATSENK